MLGLWNFVCLLAASLALHMVYITSGRFCSCFLQERPVREPSISISSETARAAAQATEGHPKPLHPSSNLEQPESTRDSTRDDMYLQTTQYTMLLFLYFTGSNTNIYTCHALPIKQRSQKERFEWRRPIFKACR